MPSKRKAEDDETENYVYQYLSKTNRPASVAELQSALGPSTGKAALVKALTNLVEDGQVQSKTYSKQAIYVVKPEMKANGHSPEEVKARDAKCNQLREKIQGLSTSNQVLQKELAGYKNQETMSVITSDISELKEKIAADKEKLDRARQGTVVIPAKEIARVDADFNKWRSLWKKRKSMFTNVWDTMSEHMESGPNGPKATRKYLEEKHDIEFDPVDFKEDPLKV